MARPGEANPAAPFSRRLGKSPLALGVTQDNPTCPEIWELGNGDVAVIGRDLTEAYVGRMPAEVNVGADERLVVIPGRMLRSAKADIPDE